MQIYQSTPDYYREYIEHGWLKDQAAKVHKYIKRWRGKNGKWMYKYQKTTIPELLNIAYKNRNNPLEGDEKIERYLENRGYQSFDDYVKNLFRGDAKRLKKLAKVIGIDNFEIPNPRQSNRGYTNSGSAHAKQAAKNSKIKTTHFLTPAEKEFARKRKSFEITSRFNQHMANKTQKESEKRAKKFKKEMEQRQSDFEKEWNKNRAKFNKMRSDFDKEYARAKKKTGR